MATSFVAASPTMVVGITTSILNTGLMGNMTRLVGKGLAEKHLKIAILAEIIKRFGYSRCRMSDCLKK